MRYLSLLLSALTCLTFASWSPLPAADLPAVAGNTNLAAAANGGRIVSFSSESLDEQGKPIPEWQASNLIDGKYVVGSYTPADSYGWSSQVPPSDERPQWIVLAFSDPRTGKDVTRLISRIVIDPTTDDPSFIGRWVQDFTLEASVTDANGPWKTIGRYKVVNRAVKQTFDFPPTEARYIRLLLTSNHGSDKCVEMGEVEIYEAIVPAEELDRLIIRMENLLEDLKRYRDGQLYQQQQRTLSQVSQKPAPEEQPGGPRPAQPAPATGAPAAAAQPETVFLAGLSLTIPPGWQRSTRTEEHPEQIKLFLLGPKAGEGQLAFTVSLEPLKEGTSLADFVTAATARVPALTSVKDEIGMLGEVTAHHFVLQGEGRTYDRYYLISQGQGLVLTAAVPPGGEEEAKPLLQSFWAGLKVIAVSPTGS